MTLSQLFKMNCQQATLLCEKKHEGKIGLAERLGLWIHLGYCSLCRLFMGQSEIIAKQAKQMNNPSLKLDSSRKEKIADSLNQKINGNA